LTATRRASRSALGNGHKSDNTADAFAAAISQSVHLLIDCLIL
jgi:hypothetical protein